MVHLLPDQGCLSPRELRRAVRKRSWRRPPRPTALHDCRRRVRCKSAESPAAVSVVVVVTHARRGLREIHVRCSRLPGSLLDEFPADRVDDGLEPVVGAQLLIDVVEVIPERLGTDPQLAHDRCWTLAFGEIPKHSMFLFRQSRYRLRSHRIVRGREELLRRSQHPLHERLRSLPIFDAAHQVHDPPASRLRILVNDGRHVHPDSPPGP
jgi:hypothetical protein